jgi:hypothetical protein
VKKHTKAIKKLT